MSHHVGLSTKGADLVIVIGGDIVSKGSSAGYALALQFFRELENSISAKVRYLVCPGNHDIIDEDRDFKDYNKFVWALTSETVCYFDATSKVSIVPIKDYDFVIINSSYHVDPKYGYVDTTALEAKLATSKAKFKVALLHHHFIPISTDKKSSLINSYETLRLLLKNNALLILHGHMHTEKILSVGINNTAVLGVGSLFDLLPGNLNNQFNLVSLEDGKLAKATSFRFVLDSNSAYDGLEGDFIPSSIEII
jgi:3',5'-cyclic AMP phosphodiesterase CpdA